MESKWKGSGCVGSGAAAAGGGVGGDNRQSKGELASSGNSEEICAEGEGRRQGKRKAPTEGIDTADEEMWGRWW